jgi:membrane associated rhomboid family serine protease
MSFSFTLGIIGITVLTSYLAWQNEDRIYKTVFYPNRIKNNKEYYRFISSGFIHKDGWHLFFNMLALYFFAEKVEWIFGIIYGSYGVFYLLALYLVGIIVADIPSYIKHRNNPHYNSLGASGGVAAVVFSSILFDPVTPICLYFAICIPGFIMGALFLVYSFYQGQKTNDSINHDAHLFGAIFGIVFTLILRPNVLNNFISKLQTWTLF